MKKLLQRALGRSEAPEPGENPTGDRRLATELIDELRRRELPASVLDSVKEHLLLELKEAKPGDFEAALARRDFVSARVRWRAAPAAKKKRLEHMREGFRILYAQSQDLDRAVGSMLKTSPLQFALELSLRRKTDPDTYDAIASVVRRRIRGWKDRNTPDALPVHLAIESTEPLRNDDFAGLIQLLKELRTWQLTKLFRSPQFDVNESLLDDFEAHGTAHPELLLEGLPPKALFRLLVLYYAGPRPERFERTVEVLRRRFGSAAPTGDLSRPEQAIAHVLRSFTPADSRQTVESVPDPLRVAVCISGQLRGFDTARETWTHLGLDSPGLSTDTFVHTWKAVGRRFPDPGIEQTMHRVFDSKEFVAAYAKCAREVGVPAFREAYPRFFQALERSTVVDEAELKAVYGANAEVVIDDEADAPFDDYSNQQKMHAKIHASIEMVGSRLDEYDLVLRIRPDKTFRKPKKPIDWPAMYRRAHEENFIFCEDGPQRRENLTIGDQLAIGAPHAMRIYASAWTLGPNPGRFGAPETFVGHSSLAYTCLYGGLRPRRCPGLVNGALRDPSKLAPGTIRAFLEPDMSERDSSQLSPVRLRQARKMDRALLATLPKRSRRVF